MDARTAHVLLVVAVIVIAAGGAAFAWVVLLQRSERRRFRAMAARSLRPSSRSRGASDAIPGIERRRVRAGHTDLGSVGPEWGIYRAPRAD